MALPKFVTRSIKPYVILLSLCMLYLAYQQMKHSEHNAQSQSIANLNTAAHLVSAQVEAASSKLFLLDNAKSIKEFDITAREILKHSPIYADIIHVNQETGQYRSAQMLPTNTEKNSHILWTPLSAFSANVAISSLYEKSPGNWVFAVRYTPNAIQQIWLEFDLKHTTQSLRGLRTLDSGYVFVVDRHTGRLVFHPDPNRIGTPSLSYESGIDGMLDSGINFAEHEYLYRSEHKVSIFDANNEFDWVFIAGTNRSEFFTASSQFALTALFILSLLYIAGALGYLSKQLGRSLSTLNGQSDITGFKRQLRSVIDRFIPHKGVQLCLYSEQHGQFSVVDFHGNNRVVLCDKQLAQQLVYSKIHMISKKLADPLAAKLQIRSNHYAIPLRNNTELVGVIYIQTWFPCSSTIIHMIRGYSEVALCNLLLHKSLMSKDVMTKLDSQHTMNASIDCHQHSENIYFAQLEIDFFEQILNHHGSQCADKIIISTAELMQTCFPKPRAISLARDGINKFSLLFHAHDKADALTKCDELRQLIEKNPVRIGELTVPYTVSIGGGLVENTHQETLCYTERALYKAKGAGRNQVSFSAFAM